MQIPNSLQNVWKEVSQDKSISADDYKKIVKTAMPNGLDEELTSEESEFINKLSSELKQNGITPKGTVPVGVLSFGKEAEVAAAPQQKQETSAEVKEPEVKPESTEATENQQTEENKPAENTNNAFGTKYSYDPPKPELPNNTVLLKWHGYNKEVNTAFTKAFGEKPAANGKVPVLSNPKSNAVTEAFGAGGVKQLQQIVGAKQDNRFGPETFFKAKIHVANEINASDNIEKMNRLKTLMGSLGNDPEIGKMQQVLDQRIGIVQNYLSTKDVVNNYFGNVNSILQQARPDNMESLVNAKQGLQSEFNKLPEGIKTIQQVNFANTDAISKIDAAISTLQGNLDTQDIARQKTQLVGDLNSILDKSIMPALTTGDSNKIKEGKAQVEAAVEKYPKIKDMEDIKGSKKQALDTLNGIETKINSVKTLINKKDWSKEEAAQAVKFSGELPPGDFKNQLDKAIEGNSEAAKLKEKAKANTPTTVKGLNDTIGNGFWNLENAEGTKGLFQLVAKQGLLPDTLKRMTHEDQTRAIGILTKDVKFDKMNEGDKFNVGIAKSMYDNLSTASNVDGDLKKKTLPDLKKIETPKNFDNNQIDLPNYVKGMKFSIGEERSGSEKEAALTMARGIMYGQVSKQALGQLNRYELSDLTKFVEKKGNKEEKQEFLKTVSQAYSEGVAVNVESLDREDKAQVIKGLLDSPNPDMSKITDLMNKSGKKVVLDLVKNKNLDDRQLVLVAKSTNGKDMADEPKVASKLLMAMIKSYNTENSGSTPKEIVEGRKNSSVKIDDIRKYIEQINKNNSLFGNNNKEAMKDVVSQLGDGPESEYSKFQKLAPATLDRIRIIAE